MEFSIGDCFFSTFRNSLIFSCKSDNGNVLKYLFACSKNQPRKKSRYANNVQITCNYIANCFKIYGFINLNFSLLKGKYTFMDEKINF